MKGIGTAAKWGVGLATAAGAGALALFGMATKASEAAANIDDVAQRTNLSNKTLQEFKHAAEMSGFSMDTIEGSAKKLTKTMGAYKDGNKATVDAFKELGLSAVGTNGKLKSTDEMFPQIIAKLADMKDITERDTISMAIFGKSAMDMGPMLNGGSKGIKDLTDEAHKMGLVMSDETVLAGAKFDDTLTAIKSSLGALVNKIGAEVLPIAQVMLQWVTDHMPQIQAITSKAFDVIGNLIKWVGGFITNTLIPAFNSARDAWGFFIDGINKDGDPEALLGSWQYWIYKIGAAISSVVDWCLKYKAILIPLVAGIAAGAITFGLYSLALGIASTATTVWASVTAFATSVGVAFGAVMAFVTSPIGLVIIAIGILVAIFVLAYNHIDGFRAIVQSSWAFIQAKTKEVFQDYIMPFIKDQLMPLFQKVFTTIGDVVKSTFALMGWAWDFILKPILTILLFYIQNVLVPTWKMAFSIIGGAVSSIFSTIGNLWSNSLKPIFNGILDFISGVFTGNWRKAWDGIISIFSGIWGGIKAIAKAPINFIIGGLNGFINGINKIKIPDWVPGLGGKGFNIPHIPSFAVGTRYLPEDMLIQAHKGEMIVPKSENPYANSGGKVNNNANNNQPFIIITQLDGKEIARTIVDPMSEELERKRQKYSLANGGSY